MPVPEALNHLNFGAAMSIRTIHSDRDVCGWAVQYGSQ